MTDYKIPRFNLPRFMRRRYKPTELNIDIRNAIGQWIKPAVANSLGATHEVPSVRHWLTYHQVVVRYKRQTTDNFQIDTANIQPPQEL